MSISQELPKIFVSMPHECGYLSDKIATTIFIDPKANISKPIYSLLARQGFRRSGDLIYRPHCEGCDACVPVRIPVAEFRPARSQRRVWQRNQDLVIREVSPGYTDEHFSLYRRYQQSRHTGSSMDTDDPDRYREFLFGSIAETRLIEMRAPTAGTAMGELLCVAVIDMLDDGLSAVYTYFEPDETRRALGVFSVLYEVELAKSLALPYTYLGYYIAESAKMNYKINYQPLQAFKYGDWIPLVKN
jgi:arginyl-tRNA--protein-N-Asp/Glu arginylyltransferase